MRPEFDKQDAKLLERRQAKFTRKTTPQVGDFVRFKDGTIRRISYVWDFEDEEARVQTADAMGGSYYLGDFLDHWEPSDDCYVCYSGGLYPGIPANTLKLTDERKEGWFWFFHHDQAEAHNGVDCTMPCRVWECSLEPN
jgi:hypothetical protein